MIETTRPAPSSQQASRQDGAVPKPKLVVFYSPTSGRCRRSEGHLAQALQRRGNHDTFELVRVDVDTRPDLAQRFHVTALPTFVVVVGRRAVHRVVSPRGVRELERELGQWLH